MRMTWSPWTVTPTSVFVFWTRTRTEGCDGDDAPEGTSRQFRAQLRSKAELTFSQVGLLKTLTFAGDVNLQSLHKFPQWMSKSKWWAWAADLGYSVSICLSAYRTSHVSPEYQLTFLWGFFYWIFDYSCGFILALLSDLSTHLLFRD